MPEIDRLLAADEANVQTMRRVFADYSPALAELLNTAVELYQTGNRAFGQTLSNETRGISPDGPAVERIQAIWLRGLLLTRIGVLYSTAVADLLRMRLTTPLGCVRLQCESLALVKLMSKDPAVAHQWMGIQTDQEGRAFFRRYQGRLKAILEGYALAETYDQTSGVALHSRFIGVARGYRTARRQDGHRIIQSESILAQEFDGKNPDLFMVQVFNILHNTGAYPCPSLRCGAGDQ